MGVMNGVGRSINYFGVVRLRDSQKRFEYGLFDNRTHMTQYIDLESELNKVYANEKDCVVSITVTLLHSGYDLESTEVVFKSEGQLFKKEVFGSYEWHVGNTSDYSGDCLGDTMFDLVGRKIMFSLEVYN